MDFGLWAHVNALSLQILGALLKCMLTILIGNRCDYKIEYNNQSRNEDFWSIKDSKS